MSRQKFIALSLQNPNNLLAFSENLFLFKREEEGYYQTLPNSIETVYDAQHLFTRLQHSRLSSISFLTTWRSDIFFRKLNMSIH